MTSLGHRRNSEQASAMANRHISTFFSNMRKITIRPWSDFYSRTCDECTNRFVMFWRITLYLNNSLFGQHVKREVRSHVLGSEVRGWVTGCVRDEGCRLHSAHFPCCYVTSCDAFTDALCISLFHRHRQMLVQYRGNIDIRFFENFSVDITQFKMLWRLINTL